MCMYAVQLHAFCGGKRTSWHFMSCLYMHRQYVCLRVHLQKCPDVCVYVLCVCVYIYIYTGNINAHTSMLYSYKYVFTCIYIYIYICMYTCTIMLEVCMLHARTHIYTQALRRPAHATTHSFVSVVKPRNTPSENVRIPFLARYLYAWNICRVSMHICIHLYLVSVRMHTCRALCM